MQEQFSSDRFKAICFEFDLRLYIWRGLVTRLTTMFTNMVRRALSIESTNLELKKDREGTTSVKSTNPPKKAKFDVGL